MNESRPRITNIFVTHPAVAYVGIRHIAGVFRMKHDLSELESDDGVSLPPYVTRSTAVRDGHLVDSPEWMAAYAVFAKFEQSFAINFTNKEVSI